LREIIGATAGMAATFTCIIAILQVGHEYRYNTIMYTLTASNSRLKAFLSKLLVLPVFSLLFGALMVVFGIGCYYLGLSFRDASLPAQEYNVLPELARLAFYMVAYGVLGFALGMLLRSVIAAIAVFFILPSMVEPLLGLLMKDKAAYLPISALDQIMGVAMGGSRISPNAAVITGAIYLAVLGIVALVLFQRRDAN
jgi:ABC-type transport system involved in multi-copper enzyme maturation permease subunit